MSDKIQYVQDSFSKYLSNPAISASDIKNFLRCPAYYFYKKYQQQREGAEETKSLAFGTFLHQFILEPGTIFNDYAIAKKFDQRTTKGKEGLKDFMEENAEKKIVTYEDFEMARNISENARKNKTLNELISESYKELSIYSEDETTGLKIRLRPDIFCRKRSVIVDIKSTMDASPRGLKRMCMPIHMLFQQVYTATLEKKTLTPLRLAKKIHLIRLRFTLFQMIFYLTVEANTEWRLI